MLTSLSLLHEQFHSWCESEASCVRDLRPAGPAAQRRALPAVVQDPLPCCHCWSVRHHLLRWDRTLSHSNGDVMFIHWINPFLHLTGNPITAVYAISANRPGYSDYFVMSPPSSYRSPSWMSYPPEPEDLPRQWNDTPVRHIVSILSSSVM